jgi:hypothetical protein
MSDTDTPPEAATEEPRKLEGLGGWFLAPLANTALWAAVYVIFTIEQLSALFSRSSVVLSGDGIRIAASIADCLLTAGIAALSIFCLVRVSQKRKRAPKLMIAVFALNAAWTIVNLTGLIVFVGNDPQRVHDAAQGIESSVALAALWSAYLLMSKRVKNTFVR